MEISEKGIDTLAIDTNRNLSSDIVINKEYDTAVIDSLLVIGSLQSMNEICESGINVYKYKDDSSDNISLVTIVIDDGKIINRFNMYNGKNELCLDFGADGTIEYVNIEESSIEKSYKSILKEGVKKEKIESKYGMYLVKENNR